MSIATEIAALTTDRDNIRAALVDHGVDIASEHGFDDFADDIASIVGGSGSAIAVTETADPHGGTVLEITAVDLSGDTVTPARLLSGYTAHNAAGDRIVGTATGGIDTSDATLNSGAQMLSGVTAYANDTKYTGTIETKTSSDLSVSGATVTVPSGYYATQATKSVTSGTATSPTSISGTSASLSTGTNTLTLSKTISVTPRITTAGYVSSGTAGNTSVSLTASITTKGAATITPSTSDQTIASGTYLTGTQTIVGDADLIGSNILSTANIFGVQGTVVIQHYYTGAGVPSSSTGVNGDIYLRTS